MKVVFISFPSLSQVSGFSAIVSMSSVSLYKISLIGFCHVEFQTLTVWLIDFYCIVLGIQPFHDDCTALWPIKYVFIWRVHRSAFIDITAISHLFCGCPINFGEISEKPFTYPRSYFKLYVNIIFPLSIVKLWKNGF